MRCFLAIALPPKLAESISRHLAPMCAELSSMRPVRTANLHLTLKFYGDLTQPDVDKLRERLPQLSTQRGFELNLVGVGAFPTNKRARVVWIGLQPIPQRVQQLHRATEQLSAELGFAPESRGFKPHLTVGRARRGEKIRNLQRWITRFDGHRFGRFPVDELVLYESQLSSEGATYHALCRIPLSDGVAV